MPAITDEAMALRRTSVFYRHGRSGLVYRKFISETLSTKSGATVPTYSNTTIALTLTSEVSSQDVPNSQSRVKVGDRLFKVRTSEMSETPPSMKSILTYGGKTYELVHYNCSADGLVYALFGRES